MINERDVAGLFLQNNKEEKMKTKIIAYCILATLLTLNSFSQNGKTHWCATDSMNNAALANNALARQSQQQFKSFVDNYIKNNPAEYFRTGGLNSSTIMYVIPVVFHVIHNYGPENISDAQIYDEMQRLKINYQGLRTDTAAVYPTFKPIIADVQIEFRLAQIDPNGNCTNGIDRIVSPLTNNADDNSKLNPWPYNQYLNIWTINSWNPAVGNPGAYAYLPGIAPPGKDGIISLHYLIGSIGTATPTNNWVITHEAAHWLGVPHIWGTSNTAGVTCGDDGIADTPITKGYTFCPQPANAAICNPPIVENYQNYMDYSPCKYMFTNGQKARMWATLNSAISLRNQVTTLSNLIATGTDGGIYVCNPTAFFDNRTVKYICEGGTVYLNDLSQNLDSTGTMFMWYSSGASPSNVTGAQATLQFPTAGVYDVSLTVSNSAGSDTYTATNYVVVSSAATASAAPLLESFETIAIPGAADWFIQTNASGANMFETTNLTSFSGNSCLQLQNYSGNAQGSISEIISEPFSLLNTTATKAYFRVAYANTTTGSNDVLKAYISTDCGASWVLRYTKNATLLPTVTTLVSANFVPVSGTLDTTQWRQDFINLNAFSNQQNVRLKFEFTFDTGNNLYIDDINISGVVGYLDLVLDPDEVRIIPNPSKGDAFVHFNLLQSNDVSIRIADMSGKKVSEAVVKNLSPGVHKQTLKTGLPKGMYILQLHAGNQFVHKKLIVH